MFFTKYKKRVPLSPITPTWPWDLQVLIDELVVSLVLVLEIYEGFL